MDDLTFKAAVILIAVISTALIAVLLLFKF